MAAAQRKRWAAVKAKSKPPKPAGLKRTMSTAARKKIAATEEMGFGEGEEDWLNQLTIDQRT
jgi:hypothetical protein